QQKWELIVISLEEATEVEPIALRFMISHDTGGGGEVEQAVVTVHGGVEFDEFGFRYVIASGPHLSYPWHPLEQPAGTAHALVGRVGEEAQHRRRVPRMGVSVGEEPAIEDKHSAYLRPERGFTPF